MLSGAVTNRYTQGLYEAAKAGNTVDAVEQSLLSLAETLAAQAEFRDFLEHPLIETAAKVSALKQVFGDSLNPMVYGFLEVLFKRNRSAYVSAIAARFHEQSEDARGRVSVVVESAQPITDDARKTLEQQLANALHKQVKAQVVINGDLLAGYRIRLGNRVLDATVRAAISQFSEQLLAAGASEEGTR